MIDGLREALEKLANDYDYIPRFRIGEVLAAHPAAPAVSLAVDREAIADAIQRVVYGTVAELSGEREVCGEAADAVLAVLAGEQVSERQEPVAVDLVAALRASIDAAKARRLGEQEQVEP